MRSGQRGGSHLHEGHAWQLQLEQWEDMEGKQEKEVLKVGVWGGETWQCRLTYQYTFLELVQVLGSMEAGDTGSGTCHPRQGSMLFARADLFPGISTPAPLLT